MLLHIPNGGMFTIGAKSMIVAAGTPPAITLLAGRTTSALGATPKLHVIIAPVVICSPTYSLSLSVGAGCALKS